MYWTAYMCKRLKKQHKPDYFKSRVMDVVSWTTFKRILPAFMTTCTCEKNSGKPGNSRCTGLSSIDLNCSLPKFLKVREPLLYVDRGIRGGVRWRDDIFQRLRHINVGSALYRHGEQVGRVVSTHGGLPMGRCLTMKQWRGRSRSPWVTPVSWTIPFLRHSSESRQFSEGPIKTVLLGVRVFYLNHSQLYR